MATGNIIGLFGDRDAVPYKVTANSTGSDGTVSRINPGEPVTKLAGAAGVIAAANNAPTTTLRIVGVATSKSTETASVDGLVDVIPIRNGQRWMCKVKVAADIDTQAKYNALIGARVLIDNTAGVYTMLSADGASQGCVIEYSDIVKCPGMIAFAFNGICNYANV